MASVQTLGPACISVTANSSAVQLSPATVTSPVMAFLVQNQGTVSVYLGDLNAASAAAIIITAGSSFNPDKQQMRDIRQDYGLDNYYVSSRSSAVSAVVAIMYQTILNRR